MEYPKVLISHQDYPELCEELVSSYFFIRKTEENVYDYLEKYKPSEIIDKILPNTTKRDVFVLSVSLYGFYEEKHLDFNVANKDLNQLWNRSMSDFPAKNVDYVIKHCYPLFFQAEKLYKIKFSFEDELYYISFWHRPTIVNYWHFQLFICDNNGCHLPRDPKPSEKETRTEEKKLRRFAVTVLEYIISEAICSRSTVKKFEF